MKSIVLLCEQMLSAEVVVEKLNEVAKSRGVKCRISANSTWEIDEVCEDSNLILLAPHCANDLEDMVAVSSCPVFIIDTTNYSNLEADKIFDFIESKIKL